MAARYTCPVLIQKNTLEVRDRLRSLGYDIGYIKECPENFGWATGAEHAVILHPDSFDYWTTSVPTARRINCGTNEEIFFALAALRSDTDRKQWFVFRENVYEDDENGRPFVKYREGQFTYCPYDEMRSCYVTKATVEEIVEHFGKPQL